MNSLCKWVLLGFALALNGCFDFDFDGRLAPETFERVAGPEDVIPYEAIGSGKLAFTREPTTFIIDADTKSAWGIKGFRGGGVLSPDGNYIALERPANSEAPSEIVVYNISRDIFTKMPGSELSINPSWTADSKYLLCLATGPPDLLVRQSVTGESKSTVTTLPPGEVGVLGPLSLHSIVSASAHDVLTFSLTTITAGVVDSGIFTINLDGTGLTQIVSDTSVRVKALSPRWAPNGDQIAYLYSLLDEYSSIIQIKVIVMNRDGSNVSTLATFKPTGFHYGDPSITWSPDGTKLAFTMFEADGGHIYVMNSDGSGITKVTQAWAGDGKLSWSR